MQKKNNPSALSKSRKKKKQEENLSNRITIRFTPEEASLIAQRAEARGLKISEYSRSAILRRKIADHSPATRDFIKKFTGMANNLNQITRYMYSKDSTPEKMFLLLEFFKEEFQKINRLFITLLTQMTMNNMFENVKSDSNAYGYNPSTGTHNDPSEYQNVAERIEVASRNMSESAAAFLDLLLEDDGTLKDFPHIKETNQILLKNHKMMENIGGKLETLSYDLKNFNKTIPSHMEVELCEDDRNLIKSFIPKWKTMLKILHPSLLVIGIVIGLFIGANLIAYNSYTNLYKEYQEKNEILDKSLKENSEAIELSEYIKTHYPKIYGKWEYSKIKE